MSGCERLGWPLRLVVALIAVALVAPTLVIIPMSFSDSDVFSFPPQGLSMRWYHELMSSPEWRQSLLTSLQLVLFAAPAATIIGTAGAFGLARLQGRWRAGAQAFVLSPLIVPNILIGLSVYGVFLRLQLNGSPLGLIVVDTFLVVPFVMIAVSTRLQGHDPRLRDAALSLGATPWRAFRAVTLPLVSPGILTGFFLASVQVFDEFIVGLFLQGPGLKPFSIKMYDSVAISIDPTISAAASVLVVVVTGTVLVAQLAVHQRAQRDTRTPRSDSVPATDRTGVEA